MHTQNFDRHISGQFNEEIENLRHHVLNMGGQVEQQLENAIRAINTLDSTLAQDVIEGDFRINAMEVSIDEECARIIAKRQPTAVDLRLILAIIKTISDLERIGDEAQRLARVAQRSFKDSDKGVLISVENLGRRVLAMLHDTLDAFARMDVDAAYIVHRQDEEIDREYDMTSRLIATYMMEDPRSIKTMMDVSWAARSLERIGDRCQNISEYIIYFVRGKDIRHTSREQMEKDLL